MPPVDPGYLATNGKRAQDRMALQLNLRRAGVSDRAVLRAMDSVPRENFVELAHLDDAYRDTALPIACGQTISQPFIVAYMTEKLRLDGSQRVLEIGTGSGYQTAVLSRLVRNIVTVERFRTLSNRSRLRLDSLGYDNVEYLIADGLALPDNLGMFDRILVTAALEAVPDALLNLLNDQGVLVAPVGPRDDVQTLVRITSHADGETVREDLINVRFVPMLPGIAREL